MKLSIFVLDGVFDTGLTVLLDTFATANELATGQGFASPPFDVRLVGVRRRIRTALGFFGIGRAGKHGRSARLVWSYRRSTPNRPSV